MSFLSPQFFWALFALSLPLLIHFFNFRRHKSVFFSNTRFLQQLERNTRSINKLKHYLILASRMAAMAALILAFTQPVLGPDQSAKKLPDYYTFYLDNSLSMGLDGTKGPLLNEARQQAADLMAKLPAQAQVQILTNELGSGGNRFFAKNEALRLIDQITLSPHFRNFSEIEKRVQEAWQSVNTQDSGQLALFLFSDFQKSFFNGWDSKKLNSQWQVQWVPLQPANLPENLAIDSVWFTKPVFKAGFEQELKVAVRNFTEQEQKEIGLQLSLNGQNAALAQVDVPALSTATVSLFITPQQNGLYTGALTLNENGPDFDNDFYFSFSTRAQPKVLMVGESLARAGLMRLFPDSLFEVQQQSLSNVAYSEIESAQLTLVHTQKPPSSGLLSALQKSLANGNNVMLFPGEKRADFQQFITAFNPNIAVESNPDSLSGGSINYRDNYFYQVFTSETNQPNLPRAYNSFALSGPNLQTLVSLENDRPLLGYFTAGLGDVFFSATSLNSRKSTLAQHPILAPVVLNAALFQGRPTVPYVRSTSAQAHQFYPLQLPGDAIVSLPWQETRLIPPQRSSTRGLQVFIPPTLPAPGNYPLLLGDSTLAHFSINLNPKESELEYFESEDLKTKTYQTDAQVLKAELDLGTSFEKLYQGRALWPYCLALAVFFLIVEVILLKIWRK